MPRPDASVKVRGATYEKLQKIARQNRMQIVQTIDVLTEAWPLLSTDQQLEVIRRPAPAAAASRR